MPAESRNEANRLNQPDLEAACLFLSTDSSGFPAICGTRPLRQALPPLASEGISGNKVVEYRWKRKSPRHEEKDARARLQEAGTTHRSC